MFIETLEDRQMFSITANPPAGPIPIPYPSTTVVIEASKTPVSNGGNVSVNSGSISFGFGSSPTLMTATSN